MTLDAAWGAVEDVLPEDCELMLIRDSTGSYTAEALRPHEKVDGKWTGGIFEEKEGPTPAAALLALAESLKQISPSPADPPTEPLHTNPTVASQAASG